jgi:hypothetical protein
MMPLSPNSVFFAGRDRCIIRRTIDVRPNELIRGINESVIGNAWERAFTDGDRRICRLLPASVANEAVKYAIGNPPDSPA